MAAGVWAFLALTDTLTFLPQWAKLLLYTTLLFGLIWFSFDCSPLHALFYTTCAYAVQHIASKVAYMPIAWLVQHGRTDGLVNFVILFFSNLVVCLVIYLLFTLRIRRGRLLFDNVKTVLYSGFFLIAAVYLSVVLEDVLDSSAESYLTAYLALNAFCILFAITILALEFSNCSIKSLEQENETLAQLLECDKQQYEQAKKDMEKINIRYHDLKQQYSRATDEERARLEEEMDNLNLRYLTGNKALDITLTQKSALCGQAGIQLVCSADGSCLEDMKHYHIYSLLGNALDNAIECLTQVNDASKRVITLDISRCRDMAVIRVQNYTPAPPTLRDGAIVTTKQNTEEHGYGIKSIKSIAEQYGATVTGVDDLNQTFELLLSGRIDATLNAEVTYYDYMKEHPDANAKIAVLTADANEVAIPMRKGDETATLRAAIDTAIEEMRADGTLKELSEKYFGTDISTNE